MKTTKNTTTVAQHTEACTITGALGEITLNSAYIKSFSTKEKVAAKLKDLGILDAGIWHTVVPTYDGRWTAILFGTRVIREFGLHTGFKIVACD
jgi:hypothetical protein